MEAFLQRPRREQTSASARTLDIPTFLSHRMFRRTEERAKRIFQQTNLLFSSVTVGFDASGSLDITSRHRKATSFLYHRRGFLLLLPAAGSYSDKCGIVSLSMVIFNSVVP